MGYRLLSNWPRLIGPLTAEGTGMWVRMPDLSLSLDWRCFHALGYREPSDG